MTSEASSVVLCCGSRLGPNFDVSLLLWESIYTRLRQLPPETEVIHGGANGVDQLCGKAAALLGLQVTRYPADWETHGRRAGVIRNVQMLDRWPNLVLAWWDGKSKGTAHTIGEAGKRKCVFRVGVCDGEGVLHAVAIVESPKGRGNMDGDTLELSRLASDGTANACSMLYGACARATFALGYRRLITYTLVSESGSSLRAAGYRVIAQRPARAGWNSPSRPRDNARYESVPRQLWETIRP